jgi:hypothetical protein
MDVLQIVMIAFYFILPAAIVAIVLYFVVRGAVLSALRKHSAEQAALFGGSSMRGSAGR